MAYNKPFFALYERFFLALQEEFGERGIEVWKKVMRDALVAAYRSSGAVEGGGMQEFMRHVGERDRALGLEVSFQAIEDGFIYRFHTDPFPGLRGKVDKKIVDDSYLSVKRDFFLGSGWSYETTKHIWDGDESSEHIFKKS